MNKRVGTKFIKAFPEGEVCVSMVEFKGEILVATNKHIYKLFEEKLHKIDIVQEQPE